MEAYLTAGRWDCHTHIYGPWNDFPLPEDAAYRPPEAPMTKLLELHERLGISNGVLVQAACYKTDHRALLAALSMSGGRYRGVALIDHDTSEEMLQCLHNGGVRGIRFNLVGHLPGERDLDALRLLADRVSAFGWHVLLHGPLQQLLPVLDAWQNLDVPLVIDHMARLNVAQAQDESSIASLAQHLRHDKRWIKLSGVDRMMSGEGAQWNAALPIARRLLKAAPGRAIWGTDWPHPNIQGDAPDDSELLNFIGEVCGDDESREAVLFHNPRKLYF